MLNNRDSFCSLLNLLQPISLCNDPPFCRHDTFLDPPLYFEPLILEFLMFWNSKIWRFPFNEIKLNWTIHYDDCIWRSIVSQNFTWPTNLPKMSLTSCKLVNTSFKPLIITHPIILYSPSLLFKSRVNNLPWSAS